MIGKRGMVRVVRTAGGRVEVDLTGKRPGRGAYVHPEAACIEKALGGSRLARALRVEIPADALRRLRGEVDHAVARLDLLGRMAARESGGSA